MRTNIVIDDKLMNEAMKLTRLNPAQTAGASQKPAREIKMGRRP
jgi:hypothetical protein